MVKWYLFLIVIFLSGCAVPESRLFTPDKNHLQHRQMETRRFDTNDEEKMLMSAIHVFQDMGYNIEETEVDLGLITANKIRPGAPLCRTVVVGHDAQGRQITRQECESTNMHTHATLVSTASRTGDGFNVRVQFVQQRRVTPGGRIVSNNRITDAATYQGFFNQLGQSLFLTANNI